MGIGHLKLMDEGRMSMTRKRKSRITNELQQAHALKTTNRLTSIPNS